jgi:DNA-directed RNA polymerase sigma subunit (sigma70/sigma32)
VTREDDTTLDGLAAQVRLFPPLDDHAVGALLARAQDPAQTIEARNLLVQHNLSAALDGALRHAKAGLDVVELFQEGSLAVTVAVDEYVRRAGRTTGLRSYVGRVVEAHLVAAIERLESDRAVVESMVRDVQLLESAEVSLRRRLEREPTTLELAALLMWPAERVETVSYMLHAARDIYDADIVNYLDDEEGDEGSTAF